jgi:hypothetical protein
VAQLGDLTRRGIDSYPHVSRRLTMPGTTILEKTQPNPSLAARHPAPGALRKSISRACGWCRMHGSGATLAKAPTVQYGLEVVATAERLTAARIKVASRVYGSLAP